MITENSELKKQQKQLNIPVVSVTKQTFLCGYVGRCVCAYIDEGDIVCSKVQECKHKNAH